MTELYRKALRVIVGVLISFALLVGTHLGEFWPFSIYPMFSRGGHPWVRAVVRNVDPAMVSWQPETEASLPGRPFPLAPAGINQNDVANFVSKSDRWDARRVGALRHVFGENLGGRALLVYRTDGRIVNGDSVAVVYTPFILLTPDATHFNPDLTYPMD